MTATRWTGIALWLLLSLGCADSERRPQSPLAPSPTQSAVAIPFDVRSVTWTCASDEASINGWVFEASCPSSFKSLPFSTAAFITVAPANLRATVTGNSVRLDWSAVLDDVRSYVVEAGSVSGTSNLARFDTGNTTPALVANDVPPGTYFVRVRAVGADGVPGPASSEITVSVSSACSGAPGPPPSLAFTVAGPVVSLTWNRPAVGFSTSYLVEAGNGPGQSNVVVFDTGTPATTLTATAPVGTYYVRVRARNACGAGLPSNEVVIGVGTSAPPPTTPPTPRPPETPTPTPPRLPPVAPPPTSPVEPVVPGTPSIEQVIPAPPTVTTPAGPAQVQIVSGGRPNAGAGPRVNVSVDSSTPLTPRVRVTSSQPFDRAAISIDLGAVPDGRLGALIVTEAYYDVRLPQPQTAMDIVLNVATTRSFTVQVAVSADGGSTYGSYASSSSSLSALTGTWVGRYQYGAECGSIAGFETLSLTETADGSLTGALTDTTLAGSFNGAATLTGLRTGVDVTFTGRYTGSYQGAVSTFRGTFTGTSIDGRLTGVCGQGAQVSFLRR